jgi:hypothetical protein
MIMGMLFKHMNKMSVIHFGTSTYHIATLEADKSLNTVQWKYCIIIAQRLALLGT